MQIGSSASDLGARLLQALQSPPQLNAQAASIEANAGGSVASKTSSRIDLEGLEETLTSGKPVARGSFVDLRV